MSHMRMPRKIQTKTSNVTFAKFDSNELKAVLSPLLAPIINQITALNESVRSLVSLLNRREGQDFDKKNIMNDFTAASITADVSLVASKNFETLKDQMNDNKDGMNRMSVKLASVEKLISTLVKRQTRKKSSADPKISEILEHFENYLISNVSKERCSMTSVKDDSLTHYSQIHIGLDPGPMQLLTLNSEHDFPQGSWLGDSSVPQSRVRCPLREDDLVYINTKCTSPEKMALALLDYLFTKETLAISNLSGKSKLGKKQLDPLMIYGIKCHLVHHFNINDKQWEKIKLNMDSKCRSAWKKRRLTSEYCISVEGDEDSLVELAGSTALQDELDRPKGRMVRTMQGDIEVLRFHDLHNVHVLDGDHILPIISSDGEDVENGILLSKCSEQSDLAVITQDTDLHSADTVSFVMEPMLEVLSEPDSIHERYIKRELEPIV